MQEDQLLALLKKGDKRAVDEWFRTFYPQILRFIKTKVSNHKDSEELSQEVFLSCLQSLPLFRGKSKIFTWMCSVARHEVADYYRKKYAKKALKLIPIGDMLLKQEVLDASQTTHQVAKTLAEMKNSYRELLLLKYVDQKKVKKIAQELGRSVKSVESDLFRARVEFKKLYAMTAYESE